MHVALWSQCLQGPLAAFFHCLVCSLQSVQVSIFSHECQMIPGGNENSLQSILAKTLTGGLPLFSTCLAFIRNYFWIFDMCFDNWLKSASWAFPRHPRGAGDAYQTCLVLFLWAVFGVPECDPQLVGGHCVLYWRLNQENTVLMTKVCPL